MRLPREYPRQLSQRLRRTPARTWRRLGAALGALLLAWAGVHAALNAEGVTTALRKKALARLEARLGPVTLGPQVSVGWFGEVRLGPLRLADGDPDAPLLDVAEIEVRPALGALLRGAAEPGRVRLVDVVLHTDRRGQRWRRFARTVEKPSGAASGGAGPGERLRSLDLELEQLQVVVDGPTLADEPHTLGPLSAWLEVERGRDGLQLDASARLPPGGKVRARGNGQDFRLELDAVPLAPLAAALGPRAVEVREGVAGGRVELHREAQGEATVKFDLGVSRLSLQGERLASEPVGPAEARFTGTLHADRQASTLSLEGAKLLLGPKKLEVPVEASLNGGEEPQFEVDARLGPVNLQQVVAALPPQLCPGPGAPALDGPVRAEVRASGPLRHVPDWTVEVRLDTAALKAAAHDQPFALREAFQYTPQEQVGTPRTFWVGERNPSYVPLAQLPAAVPAAVTTSEDGAFYVHNGFDFDELRDAFVSAEEGTRLRGGSTLSQQLVKNVYLTRERTLARKVREALITVQLEAALPKARILEIYLNLIEWGPGVYGIGEAARHYFGVDARALDVKQAVFLASIIPGPRRYGPYFRRHPLTDAWVMKMNRLLDLLHERGVLDEGAYQRALAEPLSFRPER